MFDSGRQEHVVGEGGSPQRPVPGVMPRSAVRRALEQGRLVEVECGAEPLPQPVTAIRGREPAMPAAELGWHHLSAWAR